MTGEARTQIIRGRKPGESRQLAEGFWDECYDKEEVIAPPYDLEALASLYEINPTHKACVDAKTTNIVGLGYRFVPTGAKEQSSDKNRALLEHLFSTCNPEMTFTEVMHAVWTDVETLGNGYLELTRDSHGDIDGMYHVPGATVRVRKDRQGYVQMRDGRRSDFRPLGAPPVTSPKSGDVCNEMLHFFRYTPQSSYYGVPDIIPAMPAVIGDKAAREYNVDFFTHNAVPRMAIIVEGGDLSEEVVRQLHHFMASEVKGQGHKTLVLEVPGSDTRVRLERLTAGADDDAAFLGYRRANRDEVLLVHRVPPSKVTIVENANLANSRDQDKTFREQVVRPEQRRIEYKFNRLIREQLGIGDWQLRFNTVDTSEAREEAEIARIYAGIGALTANEIRDRLGLQPLDEG